MKKVVLWSILTLFIAFFTTYGGTVFAEQSDTSSNSSQEMTEGTVETDSNEEAESEDQNKELSGEDSASEAEKEVNESVQDNSLIEDSTSESSDEEDASSEVEHPNEVEAEEQQEGDLNETPEEKTAEEDSEESELTEDRQENETPEMSPISTQSEDETPAPPYADGDSGEHIVELKEKLVELGFAGWSNPSKFYGSITTDVVKSFQQAFGLTADGIMDAESLRVLEAAVNGNLQYYDGDQGPHVVELKEKLVDLGFAGWSNPSKFYGLITASVVEDFQSYYGLPETGYADERTRSKIDEVLTPPYKSGDRGEPVVELKKKLFDVGFTPWENPSQFYGSSTTLKVQAFQEALGLTPDGIAGEETLNILNQAVQGDVPYLQNDSGSHIVDFKEKLVDLGFAGWSNPSKYYGPVTAGVVKDFQSYYDLPVTGYADENTRNKVDEVLNPPYKSGDRGKPVVELKEGLVELGFAGWSNPSQFYGSITASKVKDLQRTFGLTTDGIAREETLNLINDGLNGNIQYFINDSGSHIVDLKEKLVELEFANWSNPTKYYGPITSRVVKEFQSTYNLPVTGYANDKTLDKVNSVLSTWYRDGDSGKHIKELKRKLVTLGYANWSDPSPFYGSITESVVNDFKRDYGLKTDGVADRVTREKIDSLITKVFIDPGHGGHDPGGTGYGLEEKDVVLDIAKSAASYLTSNYLGIEINLSRTNDNFIELEERSKMANRWGADYFISIHSNAWLGKGRGFETFIHDGPVSSEAKQRQREIHDYLINKIDRVDRGKKRANFSVLRNTDMPALLVEYLFIDNKEENSLLKQSSYRNWLGRITAEAIAESFNLIRR